MPVSFNTAANTVIPESGVAQFYRGKALRAGIEAQEIANAQAPEMLDLQKRNVAVNEDNAKRLKEQVDLDAKKWVTEEGLIKAKEQALGIHELFEGSKASDDPLGYASEKLREAFDAMPDGAEKEKLGKILENGLQPEEWLGQVARAQAVLGFGEEGLKMAAPNPKDFTPESWAQYASTGDSSKLRAIPDAPLVNINNSGETAATKKYGENVGERASDVDNAAAETIEQDANLTRLELALARGAETGFGEDTLLDVRQALDTIGDKMGYKFTLSEAAKEGEVVRAIGNALALRMRNPDSGLGLTGQTSNKDLAFLKASVAGIDRSEDGNRLLIKSHKRLNEMKRAIATEQSKLIAKAGGVPIDLNAKLMKFANEYQLFTEQEKKEIESSVKQAPKTAKDLDGFDDMSPEAQQFLLENWKP